MTLSLGLPGPAEAPVPAPFEWDLPPGFPPPLVPADNPMSAAKVELGRYLFFDTRLSGNNTVSCASCHRPELAFTDGRARASGATGELHPRSAMSLVNVAYSRTLTWADPELALLEKQALVPMFNERPIEMGLAGHELDLPRRLRASPVYSWLFPTAFPEDPDPFSLTRVTQALAAFQRTLLAGGSAYDRFAFEGDAAALGPAELRGMALFSSDRLACSRCHGGFTFSGPIVFEGRSEAPPIFHNTALYDDDSRGAYPKKDRGLIDLTGRAKDMGRFRAPTLRNIALTAPYMHDGSLETLDDVIDHYAAGGRSAGNPLKSDLLDGFALTGSERADLVAFLEALTDDHLAERRGWQDPWGSDTPLFHAGGAHGVSP